ncbi:hypothetical protein ABIA39_008929 [Nocardia sp. GAS34]|uniref:hypothetical protein n=1 Tax=unclassified Nocardia TaxID=2637762 RepID=UPI003D1AF325
MIDFFIRDWEPSVVGYYRKAYMGCAYVWQTGASETFEWSVGCGEDRATRAHGYSTSLDDAKAVASAVFRALAALRQEAGPQALPVVCSVAPAELAAVGRIRDHRQVLTDVPMKSNSDYADLSELAHADMTTLSAMLDGRRPAATTSSDPVTVEPTTRRLHEFFDATGGIPIRRVSVCECTPADGAPDTPPHCPFLAVAAPSAPSQDRS